MQTQMMSPGSAADAFHTWTIIGLIVLAIGAVIVVAGILYGRRQAAERHRAEEAAEQRADEAGVDLPPEGDPVAVATDPEPVAKEPDPDLPVKAAPEPEPAPSPEPAPEPAPVAPPAPTPAPPPPAPAPAPVPVEIPQAPAPAPVTAPPAAAPEPEPATNLAGALALTTIKGLGPKVAAMMAERGITQVDQLAALSPDQASELDVQLGAFTGRMARDRWIDQARLLASGDTAAYEAEFGKLG